jgi:hypothetical protein
LAAERKSVLQRFEERLAKIEEGVFHGPAHWHLFHLHKTLDALENDHALADMHLDEYDRVALAKDFPELDSGKVPTVDEIRSRFDMVAGGSL